MVGVLTSYGKRDYRRRPGVVNALGSRNSKRGKCSFAENNFTNHHTYRVQAVVIREIFRRTEKQKRQFEFFIK